MGLAQRILRAYPGALFSTTGETYADLVWLDTTISKPTQAQVAALPEPPPPPPEVISDRQFGDGLWGDGIITYDQCLAFVSIGTIPPPLQAIVDQLPDDNTGEPSPRKSATILIKGAKEYHRSDPLVEFDREALSASDPKWTPDYLDARWRVWATL